MKTPFPFFLVLFLVTVSLGQTFSSDWKAVPLTFKGHDAKAIASKLLNGGFLKEKGEFETTKEYEARTVNAKAITLGPSLTADEILVFRYKPEDIGPGVSFKYDADSEVMTVNLSIMSITRYNRKSAEILDIEKQTLGGVTVAPHTFEDKGSYIASNAFGRQVKVDKSEVGYFKVAVNNLEAWGSASTTKAIYLTPITTTVPIPLAKAKTAKGSLEVLFVVKMVKPFFGLDFTKIEPKVDSPSEILAVTRYFVADLLEVWLFDGATGDVYAKLRPAK